MIARRGLLIGLGSVLAAPPVVSAESLMPVVPVPPGIVKRPLIGAYAYKMTFDITDRDVFGSAFLDCTLICRKPTRTVERAENHFLNCMLVGDGWPPEYRADQGGVSPAAQ